MANNDNIARVITQQSLGFDEESIKGHFGWKTIGNINIPYIRRESECYCSLRMVKQSQFGTCLSHIPREILRKCIRIYMYKITEAEARLFNEINIEHCDWAFGSDIFTAQDWAVLLSDVIELYHFSEMYLSLLLGYSNIAANKCGFIRINQHFIPYIVRNNHSVLPLFFFPESEQLRALKRILTGWDLTYLRLCFIIQGLREEYFLGEMIEVVHLTDIKRIFVFDSLFEKCLSKHLIDLHIATDQKDQVTTAILKPRNEVPQLQVSSVDTSIAGASPKNLEQVLAGSAVLSMNLQEQYGNQTSFSHYQEMTTYNGRFSLIQEISRTPYKLFRRRVCHKWIKCINMDAQNYTVHLLTLMEFQRKLYPNLGLNDCKRLIESMGLHLFKPNSGQLQVLKNCFQTYEENIPLMLVQEVKMFMRGQMLLEK